MTSKIIKQEKSERILSVTFSAEEFQQTLKAVYKKQAHRFSVPGFRKGKVPYNLAMRYYGEGVLYEDAIDTSLQQAYPELLKEHDLQPVARPEMEIKEIGADKGLTVELKITVRPEVKVSDYKGVKAEKPLADVSDEDVDNRLQKIRQSNGRMVPVEDRAAAMGDTAKIDFKGYTDGIAFDGGDGKDFDLELGSGNFIPGFEDQIVGHKPGETFEIEVTFPEDYAAKELAGKKATFEIKLHSLKFRELPDLDDEFAKDVSEFDTLDEYKADIRAKLEDDAKKRAEAQFEDAVVEAVAEKAEVEIPEAMIQMEVDNILRQQAQRMHYQGIELNQYLEYLGKTLEEYRKELRPQAEHTVKIGLTIEAVAKLEKIEVTEEEVKEEYKRLALQYGMKEEDVAARMGEDDTTKDMIRSRKAVALLVKEAKATKPSKKAEDKEKKPAKKATKAKTTKAKKEEHPEGCGCGCGCEHEEA